MFEAIPSIVDVVPIGLSVVVPIMFAPLENYIGLYSGKLYFVWLKVAVCVKAYE